MRLSSLEIQGFKSFADKTRLEFDHGITAVVGPNGSGKSNIADAVRWVLGEQSTKTLRGAKMEDVIFGGTQTRKAVGYAAVQLTIDNRDNTLPDMDEEITVSRRLYRSGESEYRIGGNMVRLKDIHELFMDTGLGRDGYSIIGQGKIAEIVSAKSSQRREIFEEASGISRFRYRKAEAERRLAQAQENLLRLKDILTELEDRVEPLRIQAEKAKSYLAMSEERKSLEISLWILSLDELKERIAKQDNKILICKNDYEHLEREGSLTEEQMNTIYSNSQALNVQAEQARGYVRGLEDQLSQDGSTIAVLKNDILHNESSVQRVEQELSSADLGVTRLQEELAAKVQELADLEQGLGQMLGKIEAAEQRLAEQREQVARTDQSLRELTVRRESVEEALSKLKLEQAASASLMMESVSRLEVLRRNSTVRDSAVTELEQNIEECQKQIVQEQEKAASLQNTRQGYALKQDSRRRKAEELQKQLRQLQDSRDQQLARAKILEDLEAGMEGFAGSVKYILSQAKKGALSGVHGPVSSLISVDQEYATAIETALGAAMQNIVVENEDVAKQAIRMLQNARSGRATFLPITSVKGKAMDEGGLAGREGFVGIASSLVEADPIFEGIIHQLLGRICIVDTLDTGAAIAKENHYRFRVVTLDGQVINAGGSYTGGSNSRSSGVLGRRHEIEELHRRAQSFQQEADDLSPTIGDITKELSSLEATLIGTDAEIQSAKEETVRLNLSLEQLHRNLQEAKGNRELADKELEGLSKRLEEIESGEVDANRMLAELEAQQAELAEQAEAASQRRESLVLGSETLSGELSEQRMTRLASEKDKDLLLSETQRLTLQIETAGTRGDQLKTEKAELEQKNGDIRRQIAEIEQNHVELKEEIGRQNSQITDLLERRTALEGETTALRTRERELSTRREEVSRELARLEEQRGSVQSEYDSIISKLWDEYELTRSAAAQLAQPLEDKDKANRRLGELRSKIRALGTVNVEAVEEYAQVSERHIFLSGQVRDVENSKEALQKLIGELTDEMRQQFTENFGKIAAHFSHIFVQLFGGGKAELTLTQEEDVLEAGVEIMVQPPGKVIKSLTLLSGGEQAFVAIAIYFAILKVKPAPFCLLDEIEAALDDVNVVKFAAYLRQMCDKTQFIAITHRRGTMEEADVLYGVTMQDEGVSKLLELKVSEVESRLGMNDESTE